MRASREDVRRRWSQVTAAAALVISIAAAGCGGERRAAGTGLCPPGCVRCEGGQCLDCTPGQITCGGGAVRACNSDGTQGAPIKTCGEREVCHEGDCLAACAVAASTRSYIGCDYWPVTTLSADLNPHFDFAVAVANPLQVGDVVQSAAAHIQLFRGGAADPVADRTVMPGTLETILLPWVKELSQNGGRGREHSGLVRGGAYHLVSDLPVTVYQFSPLQFEKPATPDCMDEPYRSCQSDDECRPGDRCVPVPGNLLESACRDSARCHSLTGDASILLPTAALQREYLAVSRATVGLSRDLGGGTRISSVAPGFVTIVGTADGSTVSVDYTAFTEEGGGVAPQRPGAQAMYALDRGDVLQLVSRRALGLCARTHTETDPAAAGPDTFCDPGPTFDLTGTRITSDQPIAVFAGHSCAFVPYHAWACDHLEEQMVPLPAWGKAVVVAQTEPQVKGEPNLWRVISGSDGNDITFDPPVHDPVRLDRAQYLEFAAEGGFLARGTGRLAVAQFMVGQNYLGFGASGAPVGDPAFGLGVSVEQLRQSYDFLTPATYTRSYVNVVAPLGTSVILDGKPLSGELSAIGGSGYGVRREQVEPGAHHITGDRAFGITVSGVALYTSYLYPGGQDFKDIAIQ